MADARTRPPHALLAGGGTGGHVFPALAVAEELSARGWQVSFTGSAAGLEASLVGARGLAFLPLPSRPILGRGPLGQARALATLARSTLAARRLIRSRGVAAVVGTGGYVSAPAVLGARLAGRPSLLVEPNADAGLANRWLSRWAGGAAVAYAATADQLRCPAWVTGVPVRSAFFGLAPMTPPAAGEPWRLLVLGGSQGARQLNLTLPPALRLLEEARPGKDGSAPPAFEVLHQAGRLQTDEAQEAYREHGPRRRAVEVVPFLDDVPAALARAHLVVSRAGAIATAELCAAGRPSVLVPLAIAAGHQQANARLLADAGAARLVAGDALTPEGLAAVLAELLADPVRLAACGRAARGLAREGAAAAIADRVAELAGWTSEGAAAVAAPASGSDDAAGGAA